MILYLIKDQLFDWNISNSLLNFDNGATYKTFAVGDTNVSYILELSVNLETTLLKISIVYDKNCVDLK